MNPIASAKHRRPKPPMTCADLTRQGRWSTKLCCVRCHEDSRLLIEEEITAENPLEGSQLAWLCCNAFHVFRYLKDWHGEDVAFPEHEE
mgnify:CR=1 FL=1